VKPGDTVVARFYDAVAYVVAPAGTKLPENAMAMAEAQAAPGELPAGGVGAKIIVTGLVVGVNPVVHTISLVNPPPPAARSAP
jgi:Na+-transporting NADH:ubiquinone oxidoreductase subunit NqrA